MAKKTNHAMNSNLFAWITEHSVSEVVISTKELDDLKYIDADDVLIYHEHQML